MFLKVIDFSADACWWGLQVNSTPISSSTIKLDFFLTLEVNKEYIEPCHHIRIYWAGLFLDTQRLPLSEQGRDAPQHQMSNYSLPSIAWKLELQLSKTVLRIMLGVCTQLGTEDHDCCCVSKWSKRPSRRRRAVVKLIMVICCNLWGWVHPRCAGLL